MEAAGRAARRARYPDCNASHAAELLARHAGLAVSRETVRRWQVAEGLRRPRRACCGELVQWDSSLHAWLGEGGEPAGLVGLVDDATGRVWARLVERDTTENHLRLLGEYLRAYGRLVAVYTDKHRIFRVTRAPTDEEHLGRPRSCVLTKTLHWGYPLPYRNTTCPHRRKGDPCHSG